MKALRAILMVPILGAAAHAGNLPPVQTVFVIVLENRVWSEIKGSPDAPLIDETLAADGFALRTVLYPPGCIRANRIISGWRPERTLGFSMTTIRPSTTRTPPTIWPRNLDRASIAWKTSQEDIVGDVVPLTAINGYVPRHNPFVYFDDVTGTNNPGDAYGLAHIRPYTELAGDLTNDSVARYNFITPNLCDDGHNSCAPQENPIRQTDDWLAIEVPKILASAAYSNNGAVFIIWDEGENGSDGPVGMILLSPLCAAAVMATTFVTRRARFCGRCRKSLAFRRSCTAPRMPPI